MSDFEIYTSFIALKNWNKELKKLPGFNLFQTSDYVSWFCSRKKFTSIYVWMKKDEETVAAIAINEETRFHGLVKMWHSFGGPLFLEPSISTMVEFGEQLLHLAKTRKVGRISRFTPPYWVTNYIFKRTYQAAFSYLGFTESSWCTSLIPTDKDKYQMLMSFPHGLKKNILKAEASGLEVQVCNTLPTFIEYHRFISSVKKEELGINVPKQFYTDLFCLLSPSVGAILIKWEGKPVAGVGHQIWDDVMYPFALGRVKDPSIPSGVYPGDLLQWYHIRLANNLGLKFYDIGGYSPDPQEKEKGIAEYKKKWGGEEVQYNNYSININILSKFLSVFRSLIK